MGIYFLFLIILMVITPIFFTIFIIKTEGHVEFEDVVGATCMTYFIMAVITVVIGLPAYHANEETDSVQIDIKSLKVNEDVLSGSFFLGSGR